MLHKTDSFDLTMDQSNGKDGGVVNRGFEEAEETQDTPNGTTQIQDGADIPERATWGNSIEFLMSCISMSVGLGNIWRFPFTAYENGGGAFLIPYIIVLFLIGKPMYYLEMALGQFTSTGSIRIWDAMPILRGVGVGQMLSAICVLTYYTALIALTLHYLIASFQAELPWAVCREEWGPDCVDSKPNPAMVNRTQENSVSSSEHYFLKFVMNEKTDISDGIGWPNWDLALYLLLAWIVVLLIIVRGVRSSGKVAYFLALFPYVVLIILLIRASTLEGSVDGIIFFLKPQWSELLNPKVWYAATTQVFYSLDICMATIIMYSSYNRFNHNIYRDAMIITTLDTFTSLLSGCTIFAILGNLAHNLGTTDIGTVVRSGTGLAFISYPDAIAKFEWVPQVRFEPENYYKASYNAFIFQLFAVLFFFMLFVLGTGSVVALHSAVNTVIGDQIPKIAYWKIAVTVAIVGYIVGLIYVTPGGLWILDLVDHFGGTFPIFAFALVEIAAFFWIYGLEKFTIDLEFMLQRRVTRYWRFSWAIVTPILMFFIFFYYVITLENPTYSGWEYSQAAIISGWCMLALILLMVPVFAAIRIGRSRELGLWEAFKHGFRPNKYWGPKNSRIKEEYTKFLTDSIEYRRKEVAINGHSWLKRKWYHLMAYYWLPKT